MATYTWQTIAIPAGERYSAPIDLAAATIAAVITPGDLLATYMYFVHDDAGAKYRITRGGDFSAIAIRPSMVAIMDQQLTAPVLSVQIEIPVVDAVTTFTIGLASGGA